MTAAKTPTATVVITTHDRQDMAERALASALAQTGVEVKVVIVDDGSTPHFVADTDDDRVVVLRNNQALGPPAARNRGLEAAQGDWVTFLDDDDVLHPRMLQESIAAASASTLPSPVSVLSGIKVVSSSGQTLETRMPPTLRKGKHYFLEDDHGEGTFQTHNTLVALLHLVRDLGGFDVELPASEHDDFFLRLNTHSSIAGLHKVMYEMTAHEGPRLSKAVLARARGMELTVARHRAVFAEHRHRYAHYQATIGVTYLRGGKWWLAVKATTRALLIDPRQWSNYKWWLASLAGPWPVQLRRRLRRQGGGG